MILLFTSDNCTWCEVVKRMLEEELNDFGIPTRIFEVNIEKQQYIAEAYDVLMVPTLVTGNNKLSGVPTESDLRSFILQSFPNATRSGNEPSRYRVFLGMQDRMKAVREEQHYMEDITTLN